MKMHESVEAIKHFWTSLSSPIQAALLVAMMSLFRFVYEDDRRKNKRRWSEVGMAMLATFILGEAAVAFGFNEKWAYVIAVGIGTYGIGYVRDKAAEKLDKKI
jgi:lambda family phage holin